MASHVFLNAKLQILNSTIDLDADDIRVALIKVVASTTCDTDVSATTISGITTLGELVATNYVRKTCVSEAVALDTPNSRAEFTFAAITWTALGGATNDTIGGILLFKFVTNDADSIPIAWIELASTQSTNGGDITYTPNSEGVLQLT